MKLLIFRLDATRYAIPLETVERVIRAVAVTPVREESSTLWGVINLRGEIVPVIDTRRLLGLSERDLELEDVFVVARTNQRAVALVADAAEPVADCPEERYIPSRAVLPEARHISGFARLEGGITIIHDLESWIASAQLAAAGMQPEKQE